MCARSGNTPVSNVTASSFASLSEKHRPRLLKLVVSSVWVYPSFLLSGVRPVAQLQLHSAPSAGTLLLGGSSYPRGYHGRIVGYALPRNSTMSLVDVNALGSE